MAAIQQTLADAARFRAETAKFLKEAFPDEHFNIPVGPADSFDASPQPTLFSEKADGGNRPKSRRPPPRPRHRPPPNAPVSGGPRPVTTGGPPASNVRGMPAVGRPTDGLPPGVLASPNMDEFPEGTPGAGGRDPFGAYLSMGTEARSAERLREFESGNAEKSWYDYHLLENFWRVKDDEKFMEERGDAERRRDNAAAEKRGDEERSERGRADRIAEDRRADDIRMHHASMDYSTAALDREIEERMRMDMEEERRDLERDRENRDLYRFDDD